MKRLLRVVLVLTLLALVAGGVALWSLLGDRERLTKLLVDYLRDNFALELALGEPASVDLIPQPGIRLRNVTLRAAGGHATLATAEAVTASVPWSALWGESAGLQGLSVERPEIDVAALEQWSSAYVGRDAGPPAAWRWPRIETRVEVYEGLFRTKDGASFEDVRISLAPLESNGRLDVWAWFARGERYVVSLEGIPRNMRAGIQLDEFRLSLRPTRSEGGEDRRPALDIAGTFDLVSVSSWEFTGTASLDSRLELLPAFVRVPIDLQLGIERNGISYGIAARGTYGDSAVDGYVLDVPIDPAADLPSMLDSVARASSGKVAIDRLDVGGAALEGIRIEAQPDAPSDER